MVLKIENSVGRKATNRPGDVKLIQTLLNTISLPQFNISTLAVDGLSGPVTERAIATFQSSVIGMTSPDGRVDPDRRTFRALTSNLTEAEAEQVRNAIRLGGPPASIPTIDGRRFRETAQKLNEVVVYHESVPASTRLVSQYSKRIIAAAALEAGMNRAVITSTFRTYEQQAAIMLRNARINLKTQYRLYGRFGDDVLKIFEDNQKLSDQEVLALMVDKIREIHSSGKKVSKHCVEAGDYRKYNVFDLGLNSNRVVNPDFNAEAFNRALEDLWHDGVINNLKDERNMSNNCWHVEIAVQPRVIENIWDKVGRAETRMYA